MREYTLLIIPLSLLLACVVVREKLPSNVEEPPATLVVVTVSKAAALLEEEVPEGPAGEKAPAVVPVYEVSVAPMEPIAPTAPIAPKVPVDVGIEEPAPEMPIVTYDYDAAYEELFVTTLTDIKALVTELNRIIRSRNYNAWVENLSDSYLEMISSSAFLAERSEELFRRDQMIASRMGRNPGSVNRRTLRTTRDYFEHIVVPSRTNDVVDDISFIDSTHVRAYTDSSGTLLILYDLELIDGHWKIIN